MTRLRTAAHRAWARTRIARELLIATTPPVAGFGVFGGTLTVTGSFALAMIAALVAVGAAELWLIRRDERRYPR